MAGKDGQMANVEYLWEKTNQLMKTNYSYPSRQVINVEYVLKAANIVDEDGLQTEPDFESQLTESNKYKAVNDDFVNKVINCVNSCARSCHSCTGTCLSGCGFVCGGCTGCNGCSTQCSGCTNACTGQRY
jgi:hypothetical protein